MSDFTARRTMMVDTQVRPSDVTKFPIIEAMLSVPRENFVPAAQREAAYMGENIELGGGRVVLEPRTLAKLLDALSLSPSELVLNVGSNLGYASAIIAHLAEAVVAVEVDESMVAEAQEALVGAGVDNAVLHTGELTQGAPEHGPYDAIVIEGGVGDVPQQILEQLKDGGRIAALFMDGALGEVRIGLKRGAQVSWRLAFNASAPMLPGFERAVAFEL